MGGPDATTDRWKQSSSAVRVSGGCPGNDISYHLPKLKSWYEALIYTICQCLFQACTTRVFFGCQGPSMKSTTSRTGLRKVHLMTENWINDKLINSLWSIDGLWGHKSKSTLTQVMACYLMVPSHYPNQSCFLIGEVVWHCPERNFTPNAKQLFCMMSLKIIPLKFLPHFPGANELN